MKKWNKTIMEASRKKTMKMLGTKPCTGMKTTKLLQRRFKTKKKTRSCSSRLQKFASNSIQPTSNSARLLRSQVTSPTGCQKTCSLPNLSRQRKPSLASFTSSVTWLKVTDTGILSFGMIAPKSTRQQSLTQTQREEKQIMSKLLTRGLLWQSISTSSTPT